MADIPDRAALDEAVALVADPAARVRLAGLQRLVRLADEHPPLRQPVVRVLGAYLRRPGGAATSGAGHGRPRVTPVPTGPSRPPSRTRPARASSARASSGTLRTVVGKAARQAAAREARAEADVRRAVLAAVRDHLSDPDEPTSWCGLDVDLRDTVLSGDLSGVRVTDGALRLDHVTVPAGETLDLGGAQVSGGVLSLDRLTVAGRLHAARLAVEGGEASFDRVVVRTAAEVVLDAVRVRSGALWLRHGVVAGGLSLRGAHLSGGTVSLHDTHVRGGDLHLDDVHVDGGTLHVGAATVDGGTLRLDGTRVTSGAVSLALTAVRTGTLSLTGVTVDGGGVGLDGLVAEEPDGVVLWGPFDPVGVAPAAAARPGQDIDLRGPAPTDRWAWLRDRTRASKMPTASRPRRHDLPSRRARAAS